MHGYIYGRWPYLYIGIGKGLHPLNRILGPPLRWLACLLLPDLRHKKKFAEGYHGKVMLPEEAVQMITVNEDIRITNLEKVIPYSRARWITPAEGIGILKVEHERGHVHHAFFKDAMLNRFYAICNCCRCCCGAIQAHENGTPMIASSGYVCRVDADLCSGCECCIESCQFGSLSMADSIAVVDVEKCMGCSVCTSKCPAGALTLIREPSKGEPLEIQKLIASSGRMT